MSKKIEGVKSAIVYPGTGGFRYTCRNAEHKVVYDSERAFSSRRQAATDVQRRWPGTAVHFDAG